MCTGRASVYMEGSNQIKGGGEGVCSKEGASVHVQGRGQVCGRTRREGPDMVQLESCFTISVGENSHAMLGI